jgi:hypothetical protein
MTTGPFLSDLIVLWLKEEIGEGHRIEFHDASMWENDNALRVDGVLVGWIYDDSRDIVLSKSVETLKAEDPEFFTKLWAHLDFLSEEFDLLYQMRLTTRKEKQE